MRDETRDKAGEAWRPRDRTLMTHYFRVLYVEEQGRYSILAMSILMFLSK